MLLILRQTKNVVKTSKDYKKNKKPDYLQLVHKYVSFSHGPVQNNCDEHHRCEKQGTSVVPFHITYPNWRDIGGGQGSRPSELMNKCLQIEKKRIHPKTAKMDLLFRTQAMPINWKALEKKDPSVHVPYRY